MVSVGAAGAVCIAAPGMCCAASACCGGAGAADPGNPAPMAAASPPSTTRRPGCDAVCASSFGGRCMPVFHWTSHVFELDTAAIEEQNHAGGKGSVPA